MSRWRQLGRRIRASLAALVAGPATGRHARPRRERRGAHPPMWLRPHRA